MLLGRPPAHVSWPNTHTLQPTVTQRHLDGLTATRVRLLLEEARGESVEMSRARETEEVPLSVVHLRLKALVVVVVVPRCEKFEVYRRNSARVVLSREQLG